MFNTVSCKYWPFFKTFIYSTTIHSSYTTYICRSVYICSRWNVWLNMGSNPEPFADRANTLPLRYRATRSYHQQRDLHSLFFAPSLAFMCSSCVRNRYTQRKSTCQIWWPHDPTSHANTWCRTRVAAVIGKHVTTGSEGQINSNILHFELIF